MMTTISRSTAAKPKVRANKITTIGFGVPTTTNPHHFQVNVPSTRKDFVEIWEHLGMKAVAEEHSKVLRSQLRLPYWKKVKHEVQVSFNRRLKEHKLKTSSWKTGNNLVDRLLGKELCVLAWTIEDINIDSIPLALNSWIGLLPEERWWLFKKAVGGSDDDFKNGYGWRSALRIALTSQVRTYHTSKPISKCQDNKNQYSFSLEKLQ